MEEIKKVVDLFHLIFCNALHENPVPCEGDDCGEEIVCLYLSEEIKPTCWDEPAHRGLILMMKKYAEQLDCTYQDIFEGLDDMREIAGQIESLIVGGSVGANLLKTFVVSRPTLMNFKFDMDDIREEEDKQTK